MVQYTFEDGFLLVDEVAMQCPEFSGADGYDCGELCPKFELQEFEPNLTPALQRQRQKMDPEEAEIARLANTRYKAKLWCCGREVAIERTAQT